MTMTPTVLMSRTVVPETEWTGGYRRPETATPSTTTAITRPRHSTPTRRNIGVRGRVAVLRRPHPSWVGGRLAVGKSRGPVSVKKYLLMADLGSALGHTLRGFTSVLEASPVSDSATVVGRIRTRVAVCLRTSSTS
jgi:hypothetical protein